METRVLRYFIAVVDEGNISSAAKVLHITQPTLSRQLKELAESLDIELFERKHRNMELTTEGRYLAEQARDILELVDRTEQNLSTKQNLYGQISIGMGESYAVTTIMNTLNKLMSEFPNIKVKLYSGNAEQITEKMDSGLLDFGVLIDPANKLKYDSLPLTKTDCWGILTHRESEFSEAKSITAEMLKDKPVIISQQEGVKNMILNLLNIKASQMYIIGSYNLLYNASLMASEKIGHVICIDNIVNTKQTNLKFIPFEPEITTSLSLVWKKNKEFSQGSKLFLEQYRDGLES